MSSSKAVDEEKLFSQSAVDKDPIGRFRLVAAAFGAFVSLLCLTMLGAYQYSNYLTAIKIQNAFTDQFTGALLDKLSEFDTKARGLHAMLQTLNEQDQYAKQFHIYIRSSMVWEDLPRLLANKKDLFSQIQEMMTAPGSPISTQDKIETGSPNNYSTDQVLLRIRDPKTSVSSIEKPALELILPLRRNWLEHAGSEAERSEKLGLLHLEIDANQLNETIQLLQDTTEFSARVQFTDYSNNQYEIQSDKFSQSYSTIFYPSFPTLTRDIGKYGGNINLEVRPTDRTYQIAGFGIIEMCLKILACFAAGILSWLLLSYNFHKAFIRQRLKLMRQLESTNEQLQHQTQKLAASHRNSEDFIGILGHEIRNPLSTLRYIQSELETMPLNEDAQVLLAIQRSALSTALDTLNNTLDLKKMELSALQLESIDFEPLLIIEEIRGLIAVQCRNKRIALQINLDPTIPAWIKGDPLRLKQVLLNLLNNAVKFTHVGGFIQLEIRNSGVTEDRVTLDFKVIDSGHGIEPGMIKKLLEPYKQADSSIARQYGGTGLGLNIASRIIQLMGGMLQIDSKIGIGSTFGFALAFKIIQPSRKELNNLEDLDKDRRMSDLQKQFDPATEKLTLVYVDDNDFNLMIAEELTKRTAHQLFTFSKPSDALQFLKEASTRVDVVLSDINMPEMNGLQFAQRVLQLGTNTKLFTVAMTASTEEEILLMNTEALDCILTKPFNLKNIVNAYNEFRSKQKNLCT